MRAGSGSKDGLTLVELMVVMAILSLILGFTVLRLDGLTASSRLKASARKIGGTIRFLQNEAIVNGRYFFMRIAFDNDRNRYSMVTTPEYVREGMDVEEIVTELPWAYLERGVQFEDIVFDDGEKWDEGIVDIPFTPTGMKWGFLIHLNNEDGRRFTVETNSITGLVQNFPYYKELDEIPEELF